MTSLVVSALTPTSPGFEARLSDCIRQDMQLCQAKFPILGSLQKKSSRTFFIRDEKDVRPDELNEVEYRGIRESIIHLPVNERMLLKLMRVFDTQSHEFRFSEPVIKLCDQGRNVIVYSVKPLR